MGSRGVEPRTPGTVLAVFRAGGARTLDLQRPNHSASRVSSVGPLLLVFMLCLSAGLCYPTFWTTGDLQPSKNLIQTSAFLLSIALELAEEAGQPLQAVSGASLNSPFFLSFLCRSWSSFSMYLLFMFLCFLVGAAPPEWRGG